MPISKPPVCNPAAPERPAGAVPQREKAERLAAALRDNLKRRKTQQRARGDAPPRGPEGEDPAHGPDRRKP